MTIGLEFWPKYLGRSSRNPHLGINSDHESFSANVKPCMVQRFNDSVLDVMTNIGPRANSHSVFRSSNALGFGVRIRLSVDFGESHQSNLF